MFEVLGINSDVVYDEVHKCFKAQSDYGAVSIRSKGEGSVVSKIRNKILNLKSIFPQSESAAGSMIGDAHGIRIIAGVSTLDEDDIAYLKRIQSNRNGIHSFQHRDIGTWNDLQYSVRFFCYLLEWVIFHLPDISDYEEV